MKHTDLTENVVFEAPTEVPDGHGGIEVGWDTIHPVRSRAHFRYLRGGETVQAARLQGKQPIVITVPSCEAVRAVTPDWRARNVRTGTVYNIRTGPVPSDDRIWAEFTVESGVAV